MVFGQISFDTDVLESGQDNIEGCYRIGCSEWKVFYFTHRRNGKFWTGQTIVRNNAVFQSGIEGVDVVISISTILNKETVKSVLSETLGVTEWTEVVGPDSLRLK